MSKTQIAIACQGGGLNAAFTAGALREILANKSDDLEIAGLSGTSAGALCAFIVWYGLQSGQEQAAIESLSALWEDFAAQSPAEQFFNQWLVNTMRLQGQGLLPEFKLSPYSPYFTLLEQQLQYSEVVGVRREFVDYQHLLEKHAPELSAIKQATASPRLLVGAVDVLSGRFKAFDSQKSEISYAAVRASGAIPWWGTKGVKIDDGIFWDGVFSQNPPIKNFVTGVPFDAKPDEIWVIRINPQSRAAEPKATDEIADRWNELSGNLSLNQELSFIQTVNKWLARANYDGQPYGRMLAGYKPIKIRIVAMGPEVSESLDFPSKLDRAPDVVQQLIADGEAQARAMLQRRQTKAD